MNIKEILTKTPCHGCLRFDRCLNEHLACKAFAKFVETGRVVGAPASPLKDPNKAIYRKLYPNEATA